MIKHKIFSKGDHIHALISTSQQPNVLIPVRCIVYDVRSVYSKGELFFQTKGQYEKALKKFLGDKYPKEDRWIEDLLYMPGNDEMDATEFN
jgi:hypothetical protein